MKLGERLTAIASLVVEGGPVADIGTDHAYLPISLIEENKIPRAIAVEINEGPFRAAQEAINRAGLTDKISLRFGNGLEPVLPGEADTITIAGMGGPTIIEILAGRPAVTASAKRLILQPMLAAGSVRRWLAANGWRIADETLVLEDQRLYEIIAAQQGVQDKMPDILFEIGPALWSKKPPLLLTHIEQLAAHTTRILQEMSQSRQAAQSDKYRELSEKLDALEEKLRCL